MLSALKNFGVTFLISALISVTKSYGWIVLIPWLLSLFRKPRHRNTNDTDKM